MGNGDIAPFILNIDNIMAALTPAPTECESKPKHSVHRRPDVRVCQMQSAKLPTAGVYKHTTDAHRNTTEGNYT